MVGGLRPSALRGGGAVHRPVAFLFALRTWPWQAVWFRTSMCPVSLKATPKTWAGRCSGFFPGLGRLEAFVGGLVSTSGI
jgi:hypothetical protein